MEENKPLERLTLAQAKEKFSKISPETGREYGVRKAFDIMIGDRLYPVYDIDGYEHPNGKWNGTPATWWLDYSEYEPIKSKQNDEDDEDFEPNIRELIPYVDKGVHRICWEIRFKQTNYTKYKWDDWDVRSSGSCEIYANGKLIYSFGARDMGYALAKAQYKIVELCEHPYDFINPEASDGRKIWYHGLPATIKQGYEPGNIRVYPDYTDISQENWWKNYYLRKTPVIIETDEESLEDLRDESYRLREDKNTGWINHGDAMWDGMIDWFRQ